MRKHAEGVCVAWWRTGERDGEGKLRGISISCIITSRYVADTTASRSSQSWHECVWRGFLFVPWVVWIALAIASPAHAEHLPCRADLDSGDSAYARFDNAAALDRFSRALSECPDDYEAMMKTSRAFIDAGEDMYSKKSEPLFVQGLRYADTLQKRFPDSGQSYFLTAVAAANIAQIKTGMQRIPLARIIDYNIRMSIAKAPGFAPAHVVLGAYCRQVAEASPVLRTLVGIFYGWIPQGTFSESERTLLKATELAPESIYAHLELARTYAAMGRRTEAINILKRMRTFPRAWHQDDTLQAEGRRLLVRLAK